MGYPSVIVFSEINVVQIRTSLNFFKKQKSSAPRRPLPVGRRPPLHARADLQSGRKGGRRRENHDCSSMLQYTPYHCSLVFSFATSHTELSRKSMQIPNRTASWTGYTTLCAF